MDQTSKILIVDDESVGRQLLEAILFPENYILDFAEDGNQAYEKAIQIKPDLVLLDVMMPGMDGFEVCRKLRGHEVLNNVPIIMITALDDRDSMIKGLDSGADDYISKPFDRIEVLTKVKNITQLDRYKRILHDKDEPDTAEKTTPNKELSLYYTSLIQKSLLPSHEYISKLLPKHFIIARSAETISSNIFWITEKNNEVIIVLCSRKHREISDILMNILGVTNLNKIISRKETIDPAEIISDLNADLQKDNLKSEKGIALFDNLNIALCILNRDNFKLQYAGLNTPLFYFRKGSDGKTDANVIDVSDKSQGNFTNYTIDLSENDSFYIFSENLLKYIERNSDLAGNKETTALIRKQHNNEIMVQESFFSEYIDKAFSESDDLKDIILFGIRI